MWSVFKNTALPMAFYILTHRGREKMAVVSQTTFSNEYVNEYAWIIYYDLTLKSLFLGVQLTSFKHWPR